MSASENPVETWETTTSGGVWIMTVDTRGVEKPKRIKGKPGFRVRITQRDREASGAKFFESHRDPFLNGTLKRVDIPDEKIVEVIPEYDVEQALSDTQLLAMFTSNGNAFRAKVSKLNERNVFRLADLADGNKEGVSTAQLAFLTEHIAENYRPGGAPADPEQD